MNSPLPSELWQAMLVNPICFVFTNPLSKQKTYFYIHASDKLPFHERVGLAMKELAPKINAVHEELLLNVIGIKEQAQPSKEVDAKWVEPHLIKCLPTRQGNGVVWEGPLHHTTGYWKVTK
jgi:hypothetical protein